MEIALINTKKTGNVRVNLSLRLVRGSFVPVEKQLSITYCECVSVTLITQRAECMCHFMLSSVVCLSLLILPRYLINGTTVREKFSEPKIFV